MSILENQARLGDGASPRKGLADQGSGRGVPEGAVRPGPARGDGQHGDADVSAEREAALFQNEKLASLGVLSAGLLHEVNNPAAAIARAAHHLAIVAEELVPAQEPVTLSPLQRADEEQAMTELLEAAGLEHPADLAASLVSQGWSPELVSANATDPTELGRLARLVHARQLALEVGMAAARISELVNAVKRWTYSGQGPVQDVDLNQVITDSCTLLRHKASGKKLELVLAEGLPTDSGEGRRVEPGRHQSHRQRPRCGGLAGDRQDHRGVRTRSWSRSPTTGPGSRPTRSLASGSRSSPPKLPASAPGSGFPSAARSSSITAVGSTWSRSPGSTVFAVHLPEPMRPP